MAQLETGNAELFPDNAQVCTKQAAEIYANSLAKEAIYAFQCKSQVAESTQTTTGTQPMNQDMKIAVDAVAAETKIAAQLVTGNILLENIETIADRLVMSRLSFWQKLAISKTNKEIAITAIVYAIVHAIKSGGFGLTGYRVNHAALDYITIAANTRMLGHVVGSLGIDTNVAGMLFKAPTVEAK